MIELISKPIAIDQNVNIYIKDSNTYVDNFSKQWKHFAKTQIDKYNNTKITLNHLTKLAFNDLDLFNDKNIIELGCGSGRYSEYLSIFSKSLIICDYSNAVFYNEYKDVNKVTAIQADIYELPIFSNKFDIVFCRGVLQHLPNPLLGIKELHNLVNKDGFVIFDIYRKPRLGALNSKYLWRKIINKISSYEKTHNFLIINAKNILQLRWRINSLLKINLNPFFDYIFPIYDYKNKLPLNEKQLIEWAILDTLDGLFAFYDQPFNFNLISKYLQDSGFKIINSSYDNSCFITQLK